MNNLDQSMAIIDAVTDKMAENRREEAERKEEERTEYQEEMNDKGLCESDFY